MIPVSASAANQTSMTGPKKAATRPVPAALDHEESDKDGERDRDHIRLERGRRELETLDRRQHGDRRRDDRIAVEQAGPGDAERDRDAAPTPERALRERDEGQRPALALVVGPQQDEDVFEGHDEHERPQDQRQHVDDDLARHVAPPPVAAATDSLKA